MSDQGSVGSDYDERLACAIEEATCRLQSQRGQQPTGGGGDDEGEEAQREAAELLAMVELLEQLGAVEEASKRQPERTASGGRESDVEGGESDVEGGESDVEGKDKGEGEAAGSGRLGEGTSAGGARPPRLGDFRIIREIARGGMGVVYEAEQVPLGRRVALKVLPFTSVLDERQLRRFENEARAAAGLDHPHIVPVYAVGSVNHVHFYAMRLICGRSLAEWITQLTASGGQAELPPEATSFEVDLSSPARARGFSRCVADLGIQAAEALQHAHESGIVHRDVKPSNLLVTRHGHLWVADFGLARLPDEASLTLSGDVVGTLRYMPPEQALLNPPTVDHRADIYSLGVTLYELLTLRPAFAAAERRGLLRQLAEYRPESPRRLNRAIPRDLETIVLKAMAEAPADRYRTAADLARDLRRFLAGEPITARRPTLRQRTASLVRRHAATVSVGMAALLLIVGLLTGGTLLIARQRDAARSAAQRAGEAASIAQHHQEIGESNFRNARRAVDRMVVTATHELEKLPASDELRHQLLEESLDFYHAFVNQDPANDQIRFDLATALRVLGEIHHRLGQDADAEQSLASSQKLLEGLLAEDPGNARYRLALAESLEDRTHTCLEKLGCCQMTARIERVRELNLRRIGLLESLAREFPAQPEYARHLARSYTDHGRALLELGWLDEAHAYLEKGLAAWRRLEDGFFLSAEDVRGEAEVWHCLGTLHLAAGRHEASEQALETALDLRHPRVADAPPEARHELARVYYDLARLRIQQGDYAAAERHLQSSLDLARKLQADFPRAVHYAYLLAACQRARFETLLARGDDQAAQEALQLSMWQLEQLAGCAEGAVKYYLPLSREYYLVGLRAWEAGQRDAGRRWFRQATDLLGMCLERFTVLSSFRAELAWMLATCPDRELRDPGEALALASQAVSDNPRMAFHWQALAAARLADEAWQDALAAADRAAAEHADRDSVTHLLRTLALARLGHSDEARRLYRQVERECRSFPHLSTQSRVLPLLAEARRLPLLLELSSKP